jgi:hypothetical protein
MEPFHQFHYRLSQTEVSSADANNQKIEALDGREKESPFTKVP